MKVLKRIFLAGLLLIGACLLLIWQANTTIENDTKNFNTSNIEKLPQQKVGLVLGTSKTLADGRQNLYFNYRIDAAAKLYNAKKVEYLIVSGDNSQKNYNEPEDMKLALIKKGVPENHIFEDFAGFRTLDSVVRAKEIFGQKSYIIVSQRLHNERAIYLAEQNGIKAYGYNAEDVSRNTGFKTNVREKFARVKVFYDLWFGIEPKYGGKKVLIP